MDRHDQQGGPPSRQDKRGSPSDRLAFGNVDPEQIPAFAQPNVGPVPCMGRMYTAMYSIGAYRSKPAACKKVIHLGGRVDALLPSKRRRVGSVPESGAHGDDQLANVPVLSRESGRGSWRASPISSTSAAPSLSSRLVTSWRHRRGEQEDVLCVGGRHGNPPKARPLTRREPAYPITRPSS